MPVSYVFVTGSDVDGNGVIAVANGVEKGSGSEEIGCEPSGCDSVVRIGMGKGAGDPVNDIVSDEELETLAACAVDAEDNTMLGYREVLVEIGFVDELPAAVSSL
ncbi:hypothetical protein LPJ64_002610 [Coemansia asiatica]|uniref:Uncharacterized protein n=1 Tax=Coemansia asiatica TaxID=1052880 RepID=A0A9W7XMR4_9FUNG|nr:hypothetical protein LPJ64_002610 [Coemansia asiatica]